VEAPQDGSSVPRGVAVWAVAVSRVWTSQPPLGSTAALSGFMEGPCRFVGTGCQDRRDGRCPASVLAANGVLAHAASKTVTRSSTWRTVRRSLSTDGRVLGLEILPASEGRLRAAGAGLVRIGLVSGFVHDAMRLRAWAGQALKVQAVRHDRHVAATLRPDQRWKSIERVVPGEGTRR
jgi:hypothetical protein